MKQQAYDIRSLRAYLLGSLSDAETERYDEMSFSDNDFNDILNSVEHDLTDAYANGELSGEELERFRAHYLASPRRRDKVDFAKEFRSFVARQNAAPAVADVREPKRGFFSIFSAPALKWGVVAATIALAVLSGWFWIQNSRLQHQLSEVAQNSGSEDARQQELERQIAALKTAGDQTNAQFTATTAERDRLQQELDDARSQVRASEAKTNTAPSPSSIKRSAPAIASFVLTPALRGSGQLPRLTIPKSAANIVMRLKLEPNDFSSYSAVLKDPDSGKTIWRSGRLRSSGAADAGSVSVSVPASLLTSKIYTMSLSGAVGSGPPDSFSDYTFQVVR